MLGRISSDVLVHYLNLAGAYIVSIAAIAVALYLCTAFSFTSIQVWFPARFSFLYAAWDRIEDWKRAREKAQAAKELEKRRAAKPVVNTQLVQKRLQDQPPIPPIAVTPAATKKTGIERMLEEDRGPRPTLGRRTGAKQHAGSDRSGGHQSR